jgi:signal transduction histidine kinase
MDNDEARIESLTQALNEARAALEKEREARQEFVSLVTHELRVPMTSIKGYTDLLLKGIMGPVSDAQANFLQTIRSNVERMSKMVADLSDINKLEGDRLAMEIEAVPAAPVVREVVGGFEGALEAKSLSLTVDLPDELPPIWCDRGLLNKVLHTLTQNAIHYTPEGGAITISAKPDPEEAGHLRIDVQDTGIGILEDEQDQIFEIFFRASDEETRAVQGNGLALHLAKRLVERQDGDLWFKSERGKGSTFFVKLPIAASQLAT